MNLPAAARLPRLPRTTPLVATLSAPSLGLWVLLAIGLAIALRAPWFDAPLGNDEGGLAYIAGAWRDGGAFPYGDFFIDRPPALLFVFRLADATGGTAAVRTIGVVAAALLILIVTLLVRELHGDRSARWAAMLTAIMASSAVIGAIYLPAEAVAVLPSAASVLCLIAADRRRRGRVLLFFGAGALALASLLVKQSFGDALVAGVVYMVAATIIGRFSRRELLSAAAVYVLGCATVVGGLEIWEHMTSVPDGSMSYALIGFRLDGLEALAGSAGGLPGRFAERLMLPLLGSGLGLIAIWSIVGLRVLAPKRLIWITIAGWGLAGGAGVLAGGSYWPHYLLQLVPFAVVTASIALSAGPVRRAKMTAGALALLAVGGFALGPSISAAAPDAAAPDIGRYLRDHANRSDTAYVLYSQANVLYYSGLESPYPYAWSLMMRAIPDAQARLRLLLASPRRPTWIVRWESVEAYGLDQSGATARLLARHYREVAEVCGYPVLLRNGSRRPSAPVASDYCS